MKKQTGEKVVDYKQNGDILLVYCERTERYYWREACGEWVGDEFKRWESGPYLSYEDAMNAED